MIDLVPGENFAGCRILSVCGHGGFGTVYLAENAVGRRVAVKIVNTPDKAAELCASPGGHLAALDAPGVLEHLRAAASPVFRYPILSGAEFRDGKWRWSDGAPLKVQAPPLTRLKVKRLRRAPSFPVNVPHVPREKR